MMPWNERKTDGAGRKTGACLFLLSAVLSFSGCDKGPKVPDFTIPEMGGGQCALAKERGKVVLLSFWSYRCPYCRKQMKEFAKLSEKIDPKKIAILAVHVFGGEALAPQLGRFVQDTKVRVCLDDRTVSKEYKNKLPKKYRIRGVPHNLILDKDGHIRKVRRGLTKVDVLERDLKRFL